jgi:hypothetical protein
MKKLLLVLTLLISTSSIAQDIHTLLRRFNHTTFKAKYPVALVATAGDKEISLAWTAQTASDTADVVRIVIRKDYAPHDTTAGKLDSTYTDTGLNDWEYCQYQIEIVDDEGNVERSNVASATTYHGALDIDNVNPVGVTTNYYGNINYGTMEQGTTEEILLTYTNNGTNDVVITNVQLFPNKGAGHANVVFKNGTFQVGTLNPEETFSDTLVVDTDDVDSAMYCHVVIVHNAETVSGLDVQNADYTVKNIVLEIFNTVVATPAKPGVTIDSVVVKSSDTLWVYGEYDANNQATTPRVIYDTDKDFGSPDSVTGTIVPYYETAVQRILIIAGLPPATEQYVKLSGTNATGYTVTAIDSGTTSAAEEPPFGDLPVPTVSVVSDSANRFVVTTDTSGVTMRTDTITGIPNYCLAKVRAFCDMINGVIYARVEWTADYWFDADNHFIPLDWVAGDLGDTVSAYSPIDSTRIMTPGDTSYVGAGGTAAYDASTANDPMSLETYNTNFSTIAGGNGNVTLIRRGDEFAPAGTGYYFGGGNIVHDVSGNRWMNPYIIDAYGTGERPYFSQRNRNSSGSFFDFHECHGLVMRNLHFYSAIRFRQNSPPTSSPTEEVNFSNIRLENVFVDGNEEGQDSASISAFINFTGETNVHPTQEYKWVNISGIDSITILNCEVRHSYGDGAPGSDDMCGFPSGGGLKLWMEGNEFWNANNREITDGMPDSSYIARNWFMNGDITQTFKITAQYGNFQEVLFYANACYNVSLNRANAYFHTPQQNWFVNNLFVMLPAGRADVNLGIGDWSGQAQFPFTGHGADVGNILANNIVIDGFFYAYGSAFDVLYEFRMIDANDPKTTDGTIYWSIGLERPNRYFYLDNTFIGNRFAGSTVTSGNYYREDIWETWNGPFNYEITWTAAQLVSALNALDRSNNNTVGWAGYTDSSVVTWQPTGIWWADREQIVCGSFPDLTFQDGSPLNGAGQIADSLQKFVISGDTIYAMKDIYGDPIGKYEYGRYTPLNIPIGPSAGGESITPSAVTINMLETTGENLGQTQATVRVEIDDNFCTLSNIYAGHGTAKDTSTFTWSIMTPGSMEPNGTNQTATRLIADLTKDTEYYWAVKFDKVGFGGADTASAIDSFTTAAADTVPVFSNLFTDQTDVAVSTTITSDSLILSSLDSAQIKVSTGDWRIGINGSWTATPGEAKGGDTVWVRHTSSASNSTTVNQTLTIGSVTEVFSTTTIAAAYSCASPEITNGDFANWTGNDPDNWYVATEDASFYVSENPTGICELYIVNYQTAKFYQTTSALTASTVYDVKLNIDSVDAGHTGTFRIYDALRGDFDWDFTTTQIDSIMTNADGLLEKSFTASGSQTVRLGLYYKSGEGNTVHLYIDDACVEAQ